MCVCCAMTDIRYITMAKPHLGRFFGVEGSAKNVILKWNDFSLGGLSKLKDKGHQMKLRNTAEK